MEAHTGEFRREDGRYQNFVAVPDMVNYYAWDRAQRKICPVEIAGQTLTGGTDIAIFDRCKVLNGGSVQSFWAKGCPACCVPTGARNTFNLVTDIVLWPREYTTKSLVIGGGICCSPPLTIGTRFFFLGLVYLCHPCLVTYLSGGFPRRGAASHPVVPLRGRLRLS